MNNLASKLLLALLPPNTPFFKMAIDDATIEELTGDANARAEVEKALNTIERAVTNEIEVKAFRVPTFDMLKHLIITGNALIYLDKEGRLKLFRLNQYVVKRDPSGNVLEIIIKEAVSPVILDANIRKMIQEKGASTPSTAATEEHEKVELYTQVIRTEREWVVKQEVANGIQLPGSNGTYPLDKSPWLALRWVAMAGEDYGRGLVEEYLGDLRSAEGLSQAILEGSAAAAKVVFLVTPNGTTNAKQLNKARNGDYVPGEQKDVHALQVDKFHDFKTALETLRGIEQRLAQAFLLMSSVQRQAERVTAEEVRIMASELEDSLGGVYSVLSQEYQYPLVKLIMTRMEEAGKLPSIPNDKIQPMVVTGLEALGRGHDLNKLSTFLQQIAPLGPEVLQQYMRIGDYITRVGTSLGIDLDGLVKSEEEVQEAIQQQQLMAAVQGAGPGVAREITKGAMQNGQGQQGQQGQGQGG